MPGNSAEVKDRPPHIQGITRQVKTGCGNMYVVVNELHGAPFEVFVIFGKSGTCIATTLGALATAISIGLRAGISLEEFTKRYIGHTCEKALPAAQNKGEAVHSCIDALGTFLLAYCEGHTYITSPPNSQSPGSSAPAIDPPPAETKPEEPKEIQVRGGKVCSHCGGGPIVYEGACDICKACGASDNCP
jgi:ribonucleoside-diphosphate reductase alpha chain